MNTRARVADTMSHERNVRIGHSLREAASREPFRIFRGATAQNKKVFARLIESVHEDKIAEIYGHVHSLPVFYGGSV